MAKMTPAEAMTAMMENLTPHQRPFGYAEAYQAAQGLTSGSAAQASAILGILGVSQFVDIDTPPGMGVPLSFPDDHRIHLENSDEWYWASANLIASDGVTRIGVLTTTQNSRLIPQKIQALAGWSDAECHVVASATTVMIHDGTHSRIIRGQPNIRWLIGGDDVVFPSVETRVYRCGEDVWTWGSEQVLPLRIQSRGGDAAIDLTLTTDMALDKAWFLQAIGGRTAPPRAGLYYSWPQLAVTGTVKVGEQVFDVSGKGWIDHQLMMATPPDAKDPPPPVPRHSAASLDRGFNGWQWCQFNLDNGDAYTGATFQDGTFRTNILSVFSGYITKENGAWVPNPIPAEWRFDALISTLHDVIQPTEWTYELKGPLPGDVSGGDVASTIVASPLHADGGFIGAGLQVNSEVAATVMMTCTPKSGPILTVSGAGYCETIDAETRAHYVLRMLDFLAEEAGRSSP